MTHLAQPKAPRKHGMLVALPRTPAARLGSMIAALLLLAATVVIVGVVREPARTNPAVPVSATEPQTRRYPARGQVRPVAYARVGTISGGVARDVLVDVGDSVQEGQELARVDGPTGTEIVRAPFGGTVTNMQARRGDTLVPGATILNLADLRRYQVETTDLDEFMIAQVHRGQPVTVLVDALERELPGQVRSVAVEPTKSPTGDDNYPVVIDLLDLPGELRPGMNVRIRFEPWGQ